MRNIVDVAATLLYSLGLPVPSDFEGEVPVEFFTEDHLMEHPIRRGARTRLVRTGAVQAEEMPDAEKEKIMKQLQFAGYFDPGPDPCHDPVQGNPLAEGRGY